MVRTFYWLQILNHPLQYSYYYYCSVLFNSTPQPSFPGQLRKQVPLSMTKEIVELGYECFPKHLRFS